MPSPKLNPEQFIGLSILGIYVLGMIFPSTMWGTHFVSFLPEYCTYVVLAICIALVLISGVYPLSRLHKSIVNKVAQLRSTVIIVFVGIVYAILFYYFPIIDDYYGNARSFIPILQHQVEDFPYESVTVLTEFKLSPGLGRQNVMHLYSLISYFFNISFQQVFQLTAAICGSLYLIIWLQFIKKSNVTITWKIIMVLMGLTSPFLLIFFGHIDTYAPLYLLVIGWLFLLHKQTQQASLTNLTLLTVLLFLGTRFHSLIYLFIPALAITWIRFYSDDVKITTAVSDLRGLIKWIYLPSCLAGLFLYFFVLEDHHDPRILDQFENIDRLFLPLFSPEPPLDQYNLLSWNHILDFFNIMFLWSPIIIFLTVTILIPNWRKIKRTNHFFNMCCITALLVITLLFMFNPLMSMPMDWDVFIFPSVLLMFMIISGLENFSDIGASTSVFFISLALSIVSIPIFIVHGSREMHSHRMESVGIHVYKTYYAHASNYILYGLQMIPDRPELYMERKARILLELKSQAMPGIDEKYADLLIDDGIYKLKYLNKVHDAQNDLEQALYYYPDAHLARQFLIETYLRLGKPELALQMALQLIQVKFPSELVAINTGVHCSVRAKRTDIALQLAERSLLLNPDDQQILNLALKLKNGVPPDSIDLH